MKQAARKAITRRKPLRILTVLGQKPGMTGSGVLVRELWREGIAAGDRHYLICAGYPGDDYKEDFGSNCSVITYSQGGQRGRIPFPIPGMSDVMPYTSIRYADLLPWQVEEHIQAFGECLSEKIESFSPDIVHIHHLWVLVSLAEACKEIPCFVTIHGTGLKQARVAPQHRHFVDHGLSRIAHLFGVSKDIAGEASALYSLGPERVTVLGNGYNSTLFRSQGPAIVRDDPIILCAGKFVPWKGFRYAIRACAQIAQPYRLVILGSGPETQRAALMDEAKRYGVVNRLELTGHLSQPDVAAWMRGASVFVLPSLHEPFGLVLLEALACGCPAVASASGGPKDILSSDLLSTGLAVLVDPLDGEESPAEERYTHDLAKSICKFLVPPSPETRSRISASVKGMEWSTVYAAMTAEYRRSLAARE